MQVLFIQIGDIHIKESLNSFPNKRANFFDSIKNKCRGVDHIFLLITGDVAYSGSEPEYEFAKGFVSSLKSKIFDYSAKEVHVICVAGNHDCDFSKKDNKAREGLIKLIQNNGSDAIDDSVLELCTSSQVNYNNFYKDFEEANHIIHKNQILTVYEYELEDKNLIFYCYNSAYMSELHEQPGKMIMPVSIFPDQYFNKKSDAAISIYHHPLNWYTPDNRRDFIYHLNRHSDIQLTGHEHTFSKKHIEDLDTDHYYCFESDVLQDSDNPKISGFNLIVLDLESSKFVVDNYKWNGVKFSTDHEKENWSNFQRGATKVKRVFEISSNFKCFLLDPGANFTHRNKPNITLKDIFVYPAFTAINYNENTGNNNNNIKLDPLDSEPIINSLKSNFQLILFGDENIGKTALLKTIYYQLYDKQFVPVYIDGHFLNSTDTGELKKHISKSFQEQYSISVLEDFENLDVNKLVLIIDDFDKSTLKIKFRARLLKKIKEAYPNFIITASDLYQLEELVTEESGEGELYETITQYQIEEFGWRLQNKLINRWNTLGIEELISDTERIRNNEEAYQIIKTVIGKNFIPKYPVFLLTILQSIEGGSPLDLQTSSFGHYYYYLIIKTLKSFVPNPSDLTTYINYLSELSYYYYINKVKTISEHTFREFHSQYKNDYGISETHKDILNILLKSNILENFDGNYEFKYIYQYYFFIAKYFADNINNDEIKNTIKELCGSLYISVNANIIIFLTHHSKDDFILDQVLNNSKKIFSELEPAKLQNDIQSINSLSSSIPKLVLKNFNIDANRDAYFDDLDKNERLIKNNSELNEESESQTTATEELDLVAQINSAFKNIEILGQILKNNYGQIKSARKLELAEEVYASGLRSLSLFFKAINDNSDYFINQIVTLINPERIPDKVEIEKMSKTLLFNFCSQISYNFIRKISDSIGSQKLEEILSKIPERNDFFSYHLIDFSIKLDYYKSFPESEMLKNAKKMENNPLSFQIVRRLVWRYLHLYQTNYQQKQRISDILRITLPATIIAQNSIKK